MEPIGASRVIRDLKTLASAMGIAKEEPARARLMRVVEIFIVVAKLISESDT